MFGVEDFEGAPSPRCHEDADEADEAPGHHVDYEEAWNCILHSFLCKCPCNSFEHVLFSLSRTSPTCNNQGYVTTSPVRHRQRHESSSGLVDRLG